MKGSTEHLLWQAAVSLKAGDSVAFCVGDHQQQRDCERLLRGKLGVTPHEMGRLTFVTAFEPSPWRATSGRSFDVLLVDDYFDEKALEVDSHKLGDIMDAIASRMKIAKTKKTQEEKEDKKT